MADGCLGLRFPERLTGPIALVDVTVVPMHTDRLVQRQTVVIDNGRIRAVGPSDEVPTQGTRVIECSGQYLMPGLADMHVHCWEHTDAALYLANGVTTVRNMRGAPLHLAMKELVAGGEVPGPRVVTASPLVDGVDSANRTTRPDSLVLTDPCAASVLVERLAARGYEQIKAYQRLRPEVLHALGAACARAGLRMTGHCPDGMSYEAAIARGMSCFEHLTGIATDRLVPTAGWSGGSTVRGSVYLEGARLLADYVDFEQIRRLAEHMSMRQVWNCPTMVVNSAGLRNSRPREEPLLRYMPLQLVRRWTWLLRHRLGARHGVVPDEHLRLVERKVDAVRKAVGLLHEAGTPLVVGTDARNPFVYPGFAVHDELTHFVEAGLTPYEALRCATSEAACFLGEAGDWGTVTEGKRADLLLLAANPLADLRAVQKPEAVFVNGFCLRRPDLDDLLAQREDWARRMEKLPPASLPTPPKRDRKMVAEGTLSETHYGAHTARISYRHWRLAGGELLIKEAHVTAPSGSQGWTRLRLTDDLVIQEGHYIVHGPVGSERCEIERHLDGHYEIRLTESDGVRSTTLLDAVALRPSERLSVSFFLLVLGRGEPTAWPDAAMIPTLTVDNGQARAVNTSLSRRGKGRGDGGSGEVSWELTVERRGEPVVQTYRFGHQGAFIDMTEAGHLAVRRLRPEPTA